MSCPVRAEGGGGDRAPVPRAPRGEALPGQRPATPAPSRLASAVTMSSAIRAEGGGRAPAPCAPGELARARPRHRPATPAPPVLRGRDDALAIRAEGGGLDRPPVLRGRRASHPIGRHTRAVLSQEAVTMRWPSGLKAAEVRRRVPLSARRAAPSHRPATPAPPVLRGGDDALPIRAERGGDHRLLVLHDRARGAAQSSSARHTRAVPSRRP